MCDMRLSHAHRVCERKLRFTAFITANVLGAVVYVPVIVTAGFAVGYGAGTHVERVVRTLGPVEYVVLTVAVVAAGTFFLWRAIRA
jgi:membrane protein DedA with SNARE-associated domain